MLTYDFDNGDLLTSIERWEALIKQYDSLVSHEEHWLQRWDQRSCSGAMSSFLTMRLQEPGRSTTSFADKLIWRRPTDTSGWNGS